MRILVYEFVTGGGMAGQPLAPSLVHQADLMVRALLADLGGIPGIDCFTTRDPRLPAIPGFETIAPRPDEAALELYQRCLATADAAWPTAPETGSALERLGQLTLRMDRVLLGTHPDTVRLTGSKRSTAAHLTSASIPAVPAFTLEDQPINIPGQWVVKPDDGAGAEDTLVVPDVGAARALLARKGPGYLAQPWLPGQPLSLSLLCANGRARLLACNRQRIRVEDGRVALTGIRVNGESSRAGLLSGLADDIARAIPLLWGHVGVDLILSESGPVVLEINPRLTTSYCGLHRVHSQNPAAWVIDLFKSGQLPPTPAPQSGTVVELNLEAAHVG